MGFGNKICTATYEIDNLPKWDRDCTRVGTRTGLAIACKVYVIGHTSIERNLIDGMLASRTGTCLLLTVVVGIVAITVRRRGRDIEIERERWRSEDKEQASLENFSLMIPPGSLSLKEVISHRRDHGGRGRAGRGDGRGDHSRAQEAWVQCIGNVVDWRNEVITQELEEGQEGEPKSVLGSMIA
jgi:hypothetical protein